MAICPFGSRMNNGHFSDAPRRLVEGVDGESSEGSTADIVVEGHPRGIVVFGA